MQDSLRLVVLLISISHVFVTSNCTSYNKKIEKRSIVKKVKVYKGEFNSYRSSGITIKIPIDWYYVSNTDSNVVGFESSYGVMGQLRVSAGDHVKDIDNYFIKELRKDRNIKYEKVEEFKGRLIAKGIFERDEKYLKEQVNYILYRSLFMLSGKLYEVLILLSYPKVDAESENKRKEIGVKVKEQGKELDIGKEELNRELFYEKALFVIDNIRASKISSNDLVLEKYGIEATLDSSWELLSKDVSKIFNVRNNSSGSIVTLEYIGVSSGVGSLSSEKLVIKAIDTFKLNLEAEKISFYNNVNELSMLGKAGVLLYDIYATIPKTKDREETKVVIKKHYIRHKKSLYELSIWQEDKKQKEDSQKALDKLLKKGIKLN